MSDGGLGGSTNQIKQSSKLVGTRPLVEAGMGGVKVSCLIDTESMVTTIPESFFRQHFQPGVGGRLQECNWLQLRAANGLEIPYLDYMELDMLVLGKTFSGMGVLVVKDPVCPLTGSQSVHTPGLLGMNISNQ